MNRPILVCALLFMTSAALVAQQAIQSNPYEGTSNPPPDDTITTNLPIASAPQTKPSPAQPIAPVAAPVQTSEQMRPQPVSANSEANSADLDGGIVAVRQSASAPQEPPLTERAYAADTDSDIVHPRPLPPGELAAGTMIRVELLERLSTADNEKGDIFRSRVASDVLQGNQVLIPSGAEIDGRIAEVSSGHLGGHGIMRLRPETVILPNGARYQLYADLTGTPDARTEVNGEGTIRPDSRFKRDSVEYGGVVAAGATTGAIMGGPVGAMTGGLIGAGVVTAHLLTSHPQATLQTGTTLLFSLAQPLQMSSASANENWK